MTNLEDIEVWWKRLGCMNNPGTHTGEEAARDEEIKELRKALAERSGHLELLKKYMKWVKGGTEYSADFVSGSIHADTEDAFTLDEWSELQRISNELRHD